MNRQGAMAETSEVGIGRDQEPQNGSDVVNFLNHRGICRYTQETLTIWMFPKIVVPNNHGLAY